MRKKDIKDTAIIIGRTLFWLMLLVLFTYTPIFAELFKINGNVLCAYYKMQKEDIALFVNIGLLGMVMIDYFGTKFAINGFRTLLLFFGIVAVFVIYVHSGIMDSNTGDNYAKIVNNNYLSMIAHVVLLLIAGYFKFVSLMKPKDERSYAATSV
jgi:hypothetical protein